MRIEGRGSCGVLIVGSLDKFATTSSFSYSSRAGAVLHRAINRIGANRDMFWLWEASPAEIAENLAAHIAELHPRCIIALGSALDESALQICTGLSGPKLGTKHLCGYVLPPAQAGWPPIVSSFHPSWLRFNNMSLLGVLMRTLRLAIQVAREQRQPQLPPVEQPPEAYKLTPTESDAIAFLDAASTKKEGFLAYDIETNYSNEEETAEEQFGTIRSIQFSLAVGSGIFMPWREPFIPVARRLLANPLPKLNWNGWRFDDPLLRDNSVRIEGANFDLMWMWHHAQPDLPRGLQFAAAMQGPNIYTPSHSWPWPWKHLDHQSPQFYGIVDVDVLQWMMAY